VGRWTVLLERFALGSIAGWAVKKKDQISEREYQDRLKGLLQGVFNTQLQPLRSLRTATKKRRALKKKAAN
jgi:hypothetical protein